jgi:hypothetical protein
MSLKKILNIVKKLHEQEIDDLMDEYEGYEDYLDLCCIIEKPYDDIYLLEFYYKDSNDDKVTSSLIIEYKNYE